VSLVRVLTAPGVAPVAVLSLDGAVQQLTLTDARGESIAWPESGAARRALIRDEAGGVLDEALVVGRPAASELHLHGGGPVLASVLRWLERAGFREGAQPTGPIPSSWRHVRALLSGRDGPLAALCSEAQAALVTGRMSAGLRDRVAAALALLPFALALRRPPVVRIVGSPNAGKRPSAGSADRGAWGPAAGRAGRGAQSSPGRRHPAG
jgi:tRNA U34 5-carboxymethylaminomethyl modifying GTPase MnmE/TrmE